MAPPISPEDAKELAENPSEYTKAKLIEKISEAFYTKQLSAKEAVIASDILRLLASDMSAAIREAISKKFANSNFLPHDIALKLAYDLDDIVAIPIIEKSNKLSDHDLQKIVDEAPITRKKAVANRDIISANLATHIAFNTPPEVVDTLLRNENVKLPQKICSDLFAHFSNDSGILKTLIQSKKIDLEQAYDLLVKVSEDLRRLIIVEYNIPSTTVNNLIIDSKEWVTLSMLKAHAEQAPNSPSVGQIITKLQDEGELSFSILIKGLSVGNIVFFEVAFAKIADTSVENIRKLLWSANSSSGFDAAYNKCKFPDSMREALWELTKIVKEEKAKNTQESVTQRIHHRLIKATESNNIKNLDYLLTIVAHNIRKLRN